MYKKDVNVHIELSDICNAMCSMCGRQYIENGKLKTVPTFNKTQLKLDDIKNIFDDEFFERFNLGRVNFCGNISDPCASSDLLSIIQYLKPNVKRIDIATNGSLKNLTYFSRLASSLKGIDHRVTFALDGLQKTHSYYRINTDYKKILANARVFLNYGGYARWQFIIFKHNMHEVNVAKKISKKLGFQEFVAIKTQRFHREEFKFTHRNKKYHLQEPEETPEYEMSGDVKCKAKKDNEFFLDHYGNVHPCCYLGGAYMKIRFNECEDSIMEFYNSKENNAIQNSLSNILTDSQFLKYLQLSWDDTPSLSCKQFCSSNKNLRKKLIS